MKHEQIERFAIQDNGAVLEISQLVNHHYPCANKYIGLKRKVILWFINRYFARRSILGRTTKLFHVS